MKTVLVLPCCKSYDSEIINMSRLIYEKKRTRYETIYSRECLGSLDEFIFPKNINITQLVIGAHSRFYRPTDARTPAMLMDLSSNTQQDRRHVGGYTLPEIAYFIVRALLLYPRLEEIKFYSCEIALNLSTELITKRSRIVHNLDGSKKKKSNKIQFSIGEKSFERYSNLIAEKQYHQLSNLEIIMCIVHNQLIYQDMPHRQISFQGLNNFGYITVENGGKVKTFSQRNICYLEDENFEQNFVDTNPAVDKIEYRFQI